MHAEEMPAAKMSWGRIEILDGRSGQHDLPLGFVKGGFTKQRVGDRGAKEDTRGGRGAGAARSYCRASKR